MKGPKLLITKLVLIEALNPCARWFNGHSQGDRGRNGTLPNSYSERGGKNSQIFRGWHVRRVDRKSFSDY